MSALDPLSRPIGWWLKEADARIEAAFAAAFAGHGTDRRGWQALNTLAASARTRADLAGALAPFADAAAVDEVVETLRRRGWLHEQDGVLSLTAEGVAAHAELNGIVLDVRGRVRAALPGDDYATLVTLLQRVVQALPGDSAPSTGG